MNEQEKQATDLFNALSATFAKYCLKPEIFVEGIADQWNCFVYQGERRCVIDCFGQTGGYAISFETNMVMNAMGRTRVKEDVASASLLWLEGHSVSELYENFKFVDQNKRFLEKLWANTLTSYPDLEQCASVKLEHRYSDIYELWISTKDRSCQIYFTDGEKLSKSRFYWDECELFEIPVQESVPLSLLLKRWLCDFALPSDLEKEFEWLDTGKLAKYYENGRGVEGEFILSWDSLERFYRETYRIMHWPVQTPNILKLIAHIRENGFDKTLRSGLQLSKLILSRSRRYGLRDEQPFVAFEFSDDHQMSVYWMNTLQLLLPKIEYTSHIDDLLKKLEAQAID